MVQSLSSNNFNKFLYKNYNLNNQEKFNLSMMNLENDKNSSLSNIDKIDCYNIQTWSSVFQGLQNTNKSCSINDYKQLMAKISYGNLKVL